MKTKKLGTQKIILIGISMLLAIGVGLKLWDQAQYSKWYHVQLQTLFETTVNTLEVEVNQEKIILEYMGGELLDRNKAAWKKAPQEEALIQLSLYKGSKAPEHMIGLAHFNPYVKRDNQEGPLYSVNDTNSDTISTLMEGIATYCYTEWTKTYGVLNNKTVTSQYDKSNLHYDDTKQTVVKGILRGEGCFKGRVILAETGEEKELEMSWQATYEKVEGQEGKVTITIPNSIGE